jgi:hypothetical protein
MSDGFVLMAGRSANPSGKSASPDGATRGRSASRVNDGGETSEGQLDRSGGSRSVQRTCAILRMIGSSGDDGVTLMDVAAAADLPKSSAHRYLQVLEAEHFIERDLRSSRYRLGSGFNSLQAGQVERLVQRTRPHFVRIRDRSTKRWTWKCSSATRSFIWRSSRAHGPCDSPPERGDRGDPCHRIRGRLWDNGSI